MREILPKVIGGVVLVAIIGGGVMMVTRHKNTVPAPVAVPGATQMAAVTPAPPLPPTENRKYKRDMLGYEAASLAATVVTKSAQEPTRTAPAISTSGIIPGVAAGSHGNSAPPPALVSAPSAGRVSIETGTLPHTIVLTSTQVKSGERLPLYYSCNEKNISPPLAWSGAPSGTKSFVVMMEGPNKGIAQALYWGVYNIPASQTSLEQAMPKIPQNEKGIGQATSEVGSVGYAGPCIPKGEGTFVFSVYALDTELKLHGGADRNEMIKAMNGHIIDMAKLPVTHYFRL